MQAKPSKQQVAAVHAVLYERRRLQNLHDEMQSIAVELNLDPRARLSPRDTRNPPGSGPNWFVPSTGAVDPAVLDAAKRCDKIAAILSEIAGELDGVDIPRADRDDLQSALSGEAAVWTLRGRSWRNPRPERDPQRFAATVAAHVQASVEAGYTVRAYRKRISELGKLA